MQDVVYMIQTSGYVEFLLIPHHWGMQADYSTQEALTAHLATRELTMNDIEQ